MSKNQGMKVWYEGMVWYDLRGHTCILGMWFVVMPFKAYHKHTEDVNAKKYLILKYFECGII